MGFSGRGGGGGRGMGGGRGSGGGRYGGMYSVIRFYVLLKIMMNKLGSNFLAF